MNSIIIPLGLSIMAHVLILCAPIDKNIKGGILPGVKKGPQSIEVALVYAVEPIVIKESVKEEVFEDIEAESYPRKENDKTGKDASVSHTGAITEDIAVHLKNEPPVYPRLARIRGWDGEVVLIAEIGKDGLVGNIGILSSSGRDVLDRSAVKAVGSWKFRGVRSKTSVEIPIRFVLK